MKKILFILFALFYYATSVSAEDPEQKFQGFNLQGYKDNGDKAWDVNGETADIVGSKVKLTNVNGNSYGQEKVNVSAQTGTMDQTNGTMLLEKDVVVTSQSGAQLLTDTLEWDRQKDLVKTEDDVVITDKGLLVTGTGMSAQPGLKAATINQDVTARINPEMKDPQSKVVTVTCDGAMEIDQSKSMGVFNDNVVAIQDGKTLKADRMEIYFDEKNSTVKKIVCLGNVSVVQGENQTFADKAVYTAEDKRMVLSGKPKLILQTEGDNGFAAIGN